MSDPWPHDAGEPMTPEEWDEQWRGVRERTREQKAAHLREHGGCGHLPHQKYKRCTRSRHPGSTGTEVGSQPPTTTCGRSATET